MVSGVQDLIIISGVLGVGWLFYTKTLLLDAFISRRLFPNPCGAHGEQMLAHVVQQGPAFTFKLSGKTAAMSADVGRLDTVQEYSTSTGYFVMAAARTVAIARRFRCEWRSLGHYKGLRFQACAPKPQARFRTYLRP